MQLSVQLAEVNTVCRWQDGHDIPIIILQQDRLRDPITRDMRRLGDLYAGRRMGVMQPPTATRRVVVVDPKWEFVVLDFGSDRGAKPYGELLVSRNGQLVAKVVIRGIEKDRSIANVMPGWTFAEVAEGDVVIPAHPES